MTILTSKLIVALVDQVTAPSRAVSAAINRMTAASQANAARMAEVRGKMLDATAAGWALWRGLSAPVNAAMQFESAMADVRKVVDFPTPEAFQEMGDDIRRLSTEMPMAADGIAAIVAAAGQSRLAVDELLPFAEMAAKVGVAWEVSADNAGEALAKLKTALGMSVAETGLLADAINHLGNNTAASAPDILDVVRRVGAQASQFGLSAEQAAAFGAAMVGAGAESEVAATSFRNMGRALTRGASATKRQSAAYKTLGLDAQNVAADMQRDAVGTITNVLERIRAVPAEARAALITDLFGDEARAIGPLITNTELLADALGLVANRAEYAGSAAEEYAIRAKTSENSLQLFRNQITSLAISIGNALLPAMNDILAIIGPVISSFSDLAARFPAVTRAIVGVAAALIGFRVAAIAAQYAGLFLKGALLDAGIAALTAARAIGSMALAPAGAAIMALRNPLRLVTAAFYALRVAIISTGVGALLAGIALAGAWIYNNWTGITIAFEAFKGAFLRAIAPIMPALQPVADGLAWLRDAVTALIAPVDEMGGSWAAAGIAAGKFVGEALTAVVAFTTDLVAAVANAWQTMSWSEIGQAAARGIGDGFLFLAGWVADLLGSIDWTGLISGASDAIGGFFNRAADTLLSVDWGSLGYRLGEMIASGIAGILNIGRILMDSLTGDGASTAAGLGSAIANGILAFDWMGVGSAILRYIGAALQAGGEFILGVIGGLIGVADLGGAATNMVEQFLAGAAAMTDRLMASGQALAQAMWDGVIAKIDAMVEWFKGLPARIVAAIGSIDFGSLITWPKPPAWVSRLWGGGQEEEVAAPTPDQGTTGEAASRITAEASAANDNAQDAINTMLAGMDRLAGGVAQEGAAAVSAADAVGSSISDNISVTAMPVIDTSSIDAARTKVDALSRSLQSMPSTAVTATSSALAGARASGGPVKAGGSYLVGEEGPEIVTFGQDGFVHDAMKTARIIRNAALGAAGMALPAAAMPALPEIPTIEIAIPEVRLPVPPQLPATHQAQEGGQSGGRGVEVSFSAGAIKIEVTAAAGQSPERVAEEVERRLTARLNALSRGAFSDGAN